MAEDPLRAELIAALAEAWPGWESRPDRDAPDLADELLPVIAGFVHGLADMLHAGASCAADQQSRDGVAAWLHDRADEVSAAGTTEEGDR